MIIQKELPEVAKNIDWTVACLSRPYDVWNVGEQIGYHGTSSDFLEKIIEYGGLRADYDKCGRGERGVFFGVDYQNQYDDLISGFQHGLNRARHKVKEVDGKGIIFQVTKEMLQTSRLEPWITLVRDDVPLEMLEQAYWLGELTPADKSLLERIGYKQFENYDFRERKEGETTRLILAKR